MCVIDVRVIDVYVLRHFIIIPGQHERNQNPESKAIISSPSSPLGNKNVYPAADPIIPSVGCEELDKENVPLKKTAVAARNVAENKQRKTKGLEYLRKDGSAVPARTIKECCRCSKLLCHQKYSNAIRAKLLESFLKLSLSAQNQFLANHISVAHVKQHTVIILIIDLFFALY